MFCQKDFINLAIGFILPWSCNMFCKSAFHPFIGLLWKMVHNTGLMHTEDFFQVQVQFASSECFFETL